MRNTTPIIIQKTNNGKVFKCFKCNLIHIEFKNLNFNFTDSQYKHFAEYIMKINGEEWESRNKDSSYSRKILIPVGSQNINIMFNNEELTELKCLLDMHQLNSNYTQHFKAPQGDFLIYLN